MNRGEIVPGADYALRERSGDEFQRVRVIEHVRRGKWRVEWIEPNSGLVDFIGSGDLVCRWGERKRFVADERRATELRAATDRNWPGVDHSLETAAEQVLDATGEMATLHKGVLSGPP